MAECFESLRHDAVTAVHYEHDDVGDVCTARTHGCKCGMARRIEEGDRVFLPVFIFVLNGVGADVLRDSARFAMGNPRFANRIHQRRLAVVHMAHENHDWCAVFQFVRLGSDLFFLGSRRRFDFLVGFVNSCSFFALLLFKFPAVLFANFCSDIRFDGLILVGEDAHAHQILDEVEGLQLHRSRQIFHDDRRLDVKNLFAALVHSGRRVRRKWRGYRLRRGYWLGGGVNARNFRQGDAVIKSGLNSLARLLRLFGTVNQRNSFCWLGWLGFFF